jgi:hypothetical protein
MTSVVNTRTVSAPFGNEREVVKVTYDFARDGGAAGQLTLFTASGNVLVKSFHAVVKTTCTSGGSATVDVGYTSDEDYFVVAAAVASLTAGAVLTSAGAVPLRLTDGQVVNMDIDTAALTAGKIEFTIEVMKD